MMLKKYTVGFFALIMLVFMPLRANAISKFLICLAIDAANVIVTPMPIKDGETEKQVLVTSNEGIMNDLKSFIQLLKYLEKLRKLSLNPASLAQDIEKVGVASLESATKGSQTIVDGFKGTVPGIAAKEVNFEKADSTEDAITKVAIVANPVGSVEETVVNERRAAFIQQSLINLHADLLVAKGKLNKLKESDTSAQSSSSTGDTIGTVNIVNRMKNYENEVQSIQEGITAMRNVLEGIKALKAAKTLSENVEVGGKND